MSQEYISRISWSDEEDEHGKIKMDCGFSCDFHKPLEFGGQEGMINPEDAFVGSLAMCYSITLRSTLNKMRLEIDNFDLEANGVLEETEEGSMITTIYLEPHIKLKDQDDENQVKRALELAKENCLISRSICSKIKVEPDLGF